MAKETLIFEAGKKYNRLTMVKEIEKTKGGQRQVLCQCDCGGPLSKHNLGRVLSGQIKSCGCIKKENKGSVPENVIGKKYGRIKVIDDLGKNLAGSRIVLGQCDCGVIKEFLLMDLRSGGTKSCGCLQRESLKERGLERREDVIGKKYGRITVIKELESVGWTRMVLGQCDCDGNIKEYMLGHLRSGITRSCGCYWMMKIKESNTYSKLYYEENHSLFCRIEEIKEDELRIGIMVRCKKCDKWYKPKSSQIWARIQAIERPFGYEENNFYCSTECKNSCPLYHLRSDPFKNQNIPWTDYELQIFSEEVRQRQLNEFGYNFCEYKDCQNEGPYHAHHERPKSVDWIFALDPDNGIVFCSEHHYGIGHSGECSTGALANKKCVQENQNGLIEKSLIGIFNLLFY